INEYKKKVKSAFQKSSNWINSGLTYISEKRSIIKTDVSELNLITEENRKKLDIMRNTLQDQQCLFENASKNSKFISQALKSYKESIFERNQTMGLIKSYTKLHHQSTEYVLKK
ncbi:hypothetical protein BY458DRAFT_417288, partial [Sporodiniella umbellata]